MFTTELSSLKRFDASLQSKRDSLKDIVTSTAQYLANDRAIKRRSLEARAVLSKRQETSPIPESEKIFDLVLEDMADLRELLNKDMVGQV